MRGDTLAAGGRSATFPAAPKISQEKWDAMWKKDEDDEIEVYRSEDEGKTFKRVKRNGK